MSTLKDKTEVSGVFGESVSATKVNGRLVFKNRPVRKQPDPSAKQVDVQERFQDSAAYAKMKMKDPAEKALYATRITPKLRSAYMVAMTDWFNPPKVRSIDTLYYKGAIGDLIVVTASDDFMVTKVNVTITDASGVNIEQGDATLSAESANEWEYKATVVNAILPGTKIRAVAYDKPRHTGELEIVI